MAGDDAGMGASVSDGVELSLCLGCPASRAPMPVRRNLTIVYGRCVLCAVDVAELQARAIISMANREMTGQVQEERDGSDAQPDQRRKGMAATPLAHEATSAPSPEDGIGGSVLPAPAFLGEQARLSMKRSLQRYLEKRKARAAAAAAWPYGVHRHAQPPEP